MTEDEILDTARDEIRAWLTNEKREEDEAILALQTRVEGLIDTLLQATSSN